MMEKLSVLAFCLAAAILGASGQKDPHYTDSRTTMVHLFEWRWADIAEECERFLGPKGFGGVQVSPPNENKIINEPNRPWYERYQPISYKLVTRSGNEEEFQSMVRRCNAAGVRIFVDAVINHMTGGGTGTGTGGSTSNGYDYPGVPFSALDFNCPQGKCPSSNCMIESYNVPDQVRNCELVDLDDLDHSKEYVRGKIVEYLNRLISYGVAGFRVDASKHMWPGDLAAIMGSLNNLPTEHGFPSGARAYVAQEVIDLGGEAISSGEYLDIGRVTEFKLCRDIGNIFRKWEGQKLAYAVNFGEGWGMLKGGDAFVFVDNHDNQRGHGAGGASVLTYHDDKLYKMATAFVLAWPYGSTRIMSSFAFDTDANTGPPHDGNMNILPVTINPDNTCGNGWVCEHRWREITNMVGFRNIAGSSPVANWWTNGENQIAFSRGNQAFIAINNDDFELNATFQTSLPGGTYCDIISGDLVNGSCTGKSITVGGDGRTTLSISNQDFDPVVAIHVGAKV